jgi:hypothetical protein
MDILFFLILGHLAGDYALQTDYMAAQKRTSTGVLSLHVLVYVLTIWAFFFFYSVLYQPGLFYRGGTIIFLGILYIEHWGQDFLKGRYQNGSKQMYYIDQVVHIVMLYLYRIFIYQ